MLVDSHCHLDYPGLAERAEAAVTTAREAGVGLMVTISTEIEKFETQVRPIAERFEDVYCSIGTHPHNAAQERDIPLERILNYAQHPKVVAIGEAGLDYHYDNAPREDQEAGFRTHIAAARETGLPLVIHSRDADEDTAKILTEEMEKGPFPFVLHCFTAGRKLAETGLALGGYISLSGVLTFKKADELRAIVRDLPIDRLLVETDAPFLAPVPHRGKTNEPAFVVHTAAQLAALRGMSETEIAKHTTENFFRLFSKVPQTAAGLVQ